jgi:hypothetical protein
MDLDFSPRCRICNPIERTEMSPRNVIEKPAPEEDTNAEEGAEATGSKYRKYPDDPVEWTPEHDCKVFVDVAKILAKAPYAARCRMHGYLMGLVQPDHAAEDMRLRALHSGYKEQAQKAAYDPGVPMVTGASNGLGALERGRF